MYYFLTQNLSGNESVAEISGHNEITGQFLWTTGQKFEKDLSLQVLELDTSEGTTMPDFFDTTIPVMSARLIKILSESGLFNFDAYPVVLKDISTGKEFKGYSAINIIGAVDAVDLDNSEYELDSFDEPEFESVAIDPEKAGEHRMFRLKTGPDLLVIDQAMADTLMDHELVNVLVLDTEDYDEIY